MGWPPGPLNVSYWDAGRCPERGAWASPCACGPRSAVPCMRGRPPFTGGPGLGEGESCQAPGQSQVSGWGGSGAAPREPVWTTVAGPSAQPWPQW